MIVDNATAAGRTALRRESGAASVVVVGSGPAGLALTLALADAGRRVLLIESGGSTSVRGGLGAAAYNQPASAEGPVDVVLGRARGLGGTAAFWHGQCTRLHPQDLRERPWVPHSGWPSLLGDETLRWYPAAESFLRLTGRGYGAQRWLEHPYERPAAWDSGLLVEDFTEYTPDVDLGSRHRDRLRDDARITAVLNATVARVLVVGSVRGVELADPEGGRTLLETGRVVLAAGAVENARLLQLSDPEGLGLGPGRRWTGRWFQTHPKVVTAQLDLAASDALERRYRRFRSSGRWLFPKLRLAEREQEREGLLDACAAFVPEHADGYVRALHRLRTAVQERQVSSVTRLDLGLAARAAPLVARDAVRRAFRGLGTAARPSRVGVEVWVEQAPAPDNRVELAAETDGLGLRRARVHWQVGELERRTTRRLTELIDAEARRTGLGALVHLPPMHDDAAWDAAVLDGHHPSGTTRASLDPTDGVVDVDLQVHGVPGLSVVGSSVMPTAGYANPTLTVVALSLRLADHLNSG